MRIVTRGVKMLFWDGPIKRQVASSIYKGQMQIAKDGVKRYKQGTVNYLQFCTDKSATLHHGQEMFNDFIDSLESRENFKSAHTVSPNKTLMNVDILRICTLLLLQQRVVMFIRRIQQLVPFHVLTILTGWFQTSSFYFLTT